MKKNALTIIELLVVVAIAGILAAIVIPRIYKSLHTIEAKNTFGNISKIGLEKAQEIRKDRDYIKYGLEHKPKLFTQEQVDAEQKKYKITQAWSAFIGISSEGLENIPPEEREALKYAIEKNLFTKKQIEAEQKKYEADRTFKINIYLKALDPNEQ